MSINTVAQNGSRIGELGNPNPTQVDSSRRRQGSTHESGSAFAKLLDGLSQTTLPTTGPGAAGAIAQPAPASRPVPSPTNTRK